MKSNLDEERIAKFSNRFNTLAETECLDKSPLYYQLSKAIALDPELLSIAQHCKARQPIPNLLLGGVHYLLSKDKSSHLRAYYPSLSKKSVEKIPYDLFKEYVVANKEELISIISSRIVQTNALNRTAYLMPLISKECEGLAAVNLVDIGCSAGLNLNLDRYEYHYNGSKRVGESLVKINSDIRKGTLPRFNKIMSLNRRIGIDQVPVNLSIEDNQLWLKGLVWPDLLDRYELLTAAIDLYTQTNDIELHQGASINDFHQIITTLPTQEPLVIYHTHVLYQFTKAERSQFRQMIADVGSQRDLKYIAVEWYTVFDAAYDQQGVIVELTNYQQGQKQVEMKAVVDGHGKWIEWL